MSDRDNFTTAISATGLALNELKLAAIDLADATGMGLMPPCSSKKLESAALGYGRAVFALTRVALDRDARGLDLGPANDVGVPAIEMRLAEHIAGNPYRDCDEAMWSAWDEASVEKALESDVRAAQASSAPRSPIERMIDEACGLAP